MLLVLLFFFRTDNCCLWWSTDFLSTISNVCVRFCAESQQCCVLLGWPLRLNIGIRPDLMFFSFYLFCSSFIRIHADKMFRRSAWNNCKKKRKKVRFFVNTNNSDEKAKFVFLSNWKIILKKNRMSWWNVVKSKVISYH